MKNDSQSLSHTKWNCKYQIVFAPKYRRQEVFGNIREDVGRILRQLCDINKTEISEAEARPDHLHLLVSIPPHQSVSQFVGYLKGKNSLMILNRQAQRSALQNTSEISCRKTLQRTNDRSRNL